MPDADRKLKLGLAQLGPVAKTETRGEVVQRMLELMHQAHAQGVQLVAYPELALTTFFPRWFIEDEAELNSYYETEMPGPQTQPLFDAAQELGLGFHLGYAELTPDGHRFNTAILVGA